MSVTGRTIDGIQSVILASLVGNTITGTYVTTTLNQAEDDQDPAVGAHEAKDGGVVVQYRGGSTPGRAVPSSVGGVVQRMWLHRFAVRVTYDVAGITGTRLATDTLALARQLVNLLEAGLEPSSGSMYAIQSISLAEPTRHPQQRGFYLQELLVTIEEAWARS